MKTKLKYHRHSSIVMGGKVVLPLLAITTVSGLVQSGIFSGSSVLASGSTVDTLTVTVKSACSLESTVLSEHNAILVPGIYSGSYIASDNSTPYASGIGSTKLTTMCNDSSGYAIYAIGYTNDTEGTTTLVGQATNQTIASGTATSGDTSNWAMKLTKVEDSSVSYSPANLTIEGGYDDFSTVPSTYTKVASFSTSTDSTLGSQLTTTYAVYLKPSQVADTYVGKVKYTLVHPAANDPSSYYVNFYANGGTGTMTSQKIGATTATQLTTNSFTAPEGKIFNGWNTQADGNGTSYTDGAEVTAIAEAGSSINLYAQWKLLICNPSGTTIGTGTDSDIVCMQDISDTNRSGIVGSMTASVNYTLYDSRDEEGYTVALLKDDKVWMTKNLNLAGGTALSVDNTDVTSEYIENLTTSGGLTKIDDTIILPISATKNSSNANLTDNAQFNTNNYSYTFNSDNRTTTCNSSTPCSSYYSWDTATLGSGRSISTDDTDAQYSICPKGWKLPTSRTVSATNWQTTSDFYALARHYGLDNTTSTSDSDGGFYMQAGPGTTPNFLLAGYYGSGFFTYGGSSGVYWSATSGPSDSSARYLSISTGNVDSANYSYRGRGFSVRCLLRGE